MAPIANMDRLGLSYDILTAEEIMERYAFPNLPTEAEAGEGKGYVGIFSGDCGCINVPLMLRTLHEMGEALGVNYFEYAEVTGLYYKTSQVGESVVVKYTQHASGE